MARRGVVDLDLVRPCPLSAGNFDIAGERGRRLVRALSFVAHRPEDHCWAHPIDGVVAYVDLIERRVVQLIDHAEMPIPAEEGNFDDPAYVGPARTSLKPIEIHQPQGASFRVDNDFVEWENWTFRIGFDPREGVVLHHRARSRPGRPLPPAPVQCPARHDAGRSRQIPSRNWTSAACRSDRTIRTAMHSPVSRRV
jgi:primary-amine oxidase